MAASNKAKAAVGAPIAPTPAAPAIAESPAASAGEKAAPTAQARPLTPDEKYRAVHNRHPGRSPLRAEDVG